MSETKELQGIAVGGHGGSALIQTPDGKLKKRVNRPPEAQFYLSLKDRNLGDGHKFIPGFHGVEEIDGASWIVIDDLTHGKAKPCILDIKMGLQSFGEDAKPDKKEAMIAKDKLTTTVTLGQRITGFRTYKIPSSDYHKLGKDVTKKIGTEDFKQHLQSFFDNGEGLRKDVVKVLLPQVKEFLAWQKSQSAIRVYSSSLLFVYDALNKEPHGYVKWIDFAHVFDIKDGGHDDGFIFGLEKLVAYFEEIAA
uniref:Kinase n=1 Tax=Arcella intermedia TaxID=1963864 RepID=A0A6B2LFF6_9EUKA